MLYIIDLMDHQFGHFRIEMSLNQCIRQTKILNLRISSFVFEPSIKHSVTRRRRKLKRFIKRSVWSWCALVWRKGPCGGELKPWSFPLRFLELSNSFENMVLILDLPMLTLVGNESI